MYGIPRDYYYYFLTVPLSNGVDLNDMLLLDTKFPYCRGREAMYYRETPTPSTTTCSTTGSSSSSVAVTRKTTWFSPCFHSWCGHIFACIGILSILIGVTTSTIPEDRYEGKGRFFFSRVSMVIIYTHSSGYIRFKEHFVACMIVRYLCHFDRWRWFSRSRA